MRRRRLFESLFLRFVERCDNKAEQQLMHRSFVLSVFLEEDEHDDDN